MAEVQRLELGAIAIPPLSCGNGGLEWAVVRPLIVDAFAALPTVQVLIFEPSLAPAQVQVNTSKPPMTRSRALVVSLFDRYGIPGYRLGRLEAQKLAYLLQEAGEQGLKLEFRPHHYGPYADKLNHNVLSLNHGLGLGGVKGTAQGIHHQKMVGRVVTLDL